MPMTDEIHTGEIATATDHILALRNYPRKTTYLLAALEDVFERFGSIPEPAQERLMNYFSLTEMPDSFPFLLFEDRTPDHAVVSVCGGPFCQRAGSDALLSKLKHQLKETTKEGAVSSVEQQHCMGACQSAPSVKIGGTLITEATVEKVKDSLKQA